MWTLTPDLQDSTCSSRVVASFHDTCPIRVYSSKRMPISNRAVDNPATSSHHTSTVGGPDPESHMTTRQGCCVTAIYSFICSCVDCPVLAARAAHCNPQPNCLGFSILSGLNFAANVAPEGFVVVEAWREGGGAVELRIASRQATFVPLTMAFVSKTPKSQYKSVNVNVCSNHGQQILLSMPDCWWIPVFSFFI